MTRVIQISFLAVGLTCQTCLGVSGEGGSGIAVTHINDLCVHDPCILADTNSMTYYVYRSFSPGRYGNTSTSGTNDAGIQVFWSTNLVEWLGPTNVFVIPDGFWADRDANPWAPEVHAYQDKYYLFTTFNAWKEQMDESPNRPFINKRASQVLVADSPLGPFRPFGNEPHTPKGEMTLDATLWVEEDQPWLVYCQEWVQLGDGLIKAIRLKNDLSKTAGEAITLINAADASWARTNVNYRGTRYSGVVTDGPYFNKATGGKLLLFWSLLPALLAGLYVGPAASFPFEYISADQDDFAAFARFVNRDTNQPWLAVFASHDLHNPWNRGPKNLYDPAKLTVPPYLHDNDVTRKLLAAYYAEVTLLDSLVGALLKILDEGKQADNTLVMFVSEQGSSFPYGGKWSVYDNGIHSATVIRWPGKVKPGTSNDAMIEYLDVPPTLVAIIGEDPTKIDTGCSDAKGDRGFDGRSFLDVVLGKSDHLRDYVFAQNTTVGIIGYKEPYPIRSARDTRYKYIRNLMPENTYEIGGIHKGQPLDSWKADAVNDPALAKRIDWLYHRPGEELYNLQIDPLETNNLAANPEFATVKARLSGQTDAWMATRALPRRWSPTPGKVRPARKRTIPRT